MCVVVVVLVLAPVVLVVGVGVGIGVIGVSVVGVWLGRAMKGFLCQLTKKALARFGHFFLCFICQPKRSFSSFILWGTVFRWNQPTKTVAHVCQGFGEAC